MKAIKQTNEYMLVDVKNTHYAGDYQILAINTHYPKGHTCGVYFKRKDALEAFFILTTK